MGCRAGHAYALQKSLGLSQVPGLLRLGELGVMPRLQPGGIQGRGNASATQAQCCQSNSRSGDVRLDERVRTGPRTTGVAETMAESASSSKASMRRCARSLGMAAVMIVAPPATGAS